MTILQRNWQAWLQRAGPAACVLAALTIGLRQTGTALDDAYITYRYAQNLANGQGFVYNPGEAVLGTTAPLYGLLLGALNVLGLDIPETGRVISVLAWAACAGLVALIACAAGRKALMLPAAAAVATCPLFLNTIGMETTLVMASSLWAMYLYLRGHTQGAFAIAGVATLLRPDCALVAAVLGAAYLLERRALPWREAAIYLAVLLPWLIYAQITYGSFLPNSFFAKAGLGHKSFMGNDRLWPFLTGLKSTMAELYAGSKGVILVGLLALLGAGEAVVAGGRHLIVVLWAVLYLAAYAALGVPPFIWYYPPIYPAVALLAAAGIAWLARRLGKSAPAALRRWPYAAALTAAVAAVQLAALPRYLVTEPGPYYQGYAAVGSWLRENTPANASVAMIEIGIIGYQADRRVIDTMGLVSRDMTSHLLDWQQTLAYAVNHYWPAYAVALDGTAWDGMTATPWFRAAYSPTAVIPSAGPGSRKATIYQKRPGYPIRDVAAAGADELLAGPAISLASMRAQVADLDAGQAGPEGPGPALFLQLDWRARETTKGDYLATVRFIGAQSGEQWYLVEEQPMRGGNPTFLWQPGEAVNDDYVLPLPRDLPPGPYMVEAGLVDAGTGEPLSFTDVAGEPVPHATAGPVWLKSSSAPAAAGQPLAGFTARGGDINLRSFQVMPAELEPGDALDVTLNWEASEPLREDYTVFVHVEDASGVRAAGQDNPPLGGKLPTSLWAPGVIVEDHYRVILPADLARGQYTVSAGLYRYADGARLPVQSADLPARDQALSLGSITIR